MRNKKIISLLCTAALLTPGFSAYAADSTLDFMKKEYRSLEGTMAMSAKLNKPLDVLSYIPTGGIENHVDIQRLVESALKSTSEYSCKAVTDLDKKQIRLEMSGKSNMPFEINKNLEVSVDARDGLWLDLDLSNPETPTYQMIMQSPLFEKYMYLDMTEDIYSAKPTAASAVSIIGGADGPTSIYVAEEDEAASASMAEYSPADMLSAILDRDAYTALQEKNIELTAENASVSKKGNTVTVSFTDKGFKRYFAGLLSESYSMMGLNVSDLFGITDNAEAEDILKKLYELPIFNEKEAYTAVYHLDSRGYIKSAETTLNINTCLYDLIPLVTGEAVDELPRERSYLDLSLYTDIQYSKLNTSLSIKMPELTEENSFNPMHMSSEEIADESYFDYSQCECESYELYTGKMDFSQGAAAIPIRDVFEGAAVAYDSGKITVVKDGGEETYFGGSWYDGLFSDSASVTVGSRTAYIDGTEVTLSDAPYIVDGTAFLTIRSFEGLSGMQADDFYGYKDGDGVGFRYCIYVNKTCDYCKNRYYSEGDEV